MLGLYPICTIGSSHDRIHFMRTKCLKVIIRWQKCDSKVGEYVEKMTWICFLMTGGKNGKKL